MAKQSSKEYLWDKLRLCDALIAEKNATIVRLEAENKALQHRRDRIAKHWKEAVENSWRANP